MTGAYRELIEKCSRFRRTPVIDPDFYEVMQGYIMVVDKIESLPPLPKIVCLCGSTKFLAQYLDANRSETMAGNIVLTVGCFNRVDTHSLSLQEKELLDELHKRKIDLADEILVINVDGYVGESTASEIDYAKKQGKLVRWLEPVERSHG